MTDKNKNYENEFSQKYQQDSRVNKLYILNYLRGYVQYTHNV